MHIPGDPQNVQLRNATTTTIQKKNNNNNKTTKEEAGTRRYVLRVSRKRLPVGYSVLMFGKNSLRPTNFILNGHIKTLQYTLSIEAIFFFSSTRLFPPPTRKSVRLRSTQLTHQSAHGITGRGKSFYRQTSEHNSMRRLPGSLSY